jgi:hypothetical protein
LLGSSEDAAARRLRNLRDDGLLREDRLYDGYPPCYQVTRAGLGATGSERRAPRAIDRAHYRHDVGVGWLYLAARAGAFGELREVVSERTMRSRDGVRETDRPLGPERFGVRLGGTGPGGRERLHYPDLLLVDRNGRRIAVELELSAKDRRRREKILAGYAIDSRIDAVVYLVDRPAVGDAVRTSARQLGMSDLVHVQPVRWGKDAPPLGRAPAVSRTRGPGPAAKAAAR